MHNSIYAYSRNLIQKLDADPTYERIVEVYGHNGQLVAGLYRRAVNQ